MPQIIMAVAAVAGAVMSYKQAKDQKKAGKAAQDLANINATHAREEAIKNEKDLKDQQMADAGKRRAAVAASGAGGKSQTALLDFYDEQASSDMAFLQKVGKSNYAVEGQKGVIAKKTSDAKKTGLYGQAVGQLGQAGVSLASAKSPSTGKSFWTG